MCISHGMDRLQPAVYRSVGCTSTIQTKNAPETSRKQVTSQQFKHIVDWFFQTTLKIKSEKHVLQQGRYLKKSAISDLCTQKNGIR